MKAPAGERRAHTPRSHPAGSSSTASTRNHEPSPPVSETSANPSRHDPCSPPASDRDKTDRIPQPGPHCSPPSCRRDHNRTRPRTLPAAANAPRTRKAAMPDPTPLRTADDVSSGPTSFPKFRIMKKNLSKRIALFSKRSNPGLPKKHSGGIVMF
ncbi:hypothetical protein SDC9_133818 [bioreactor metagenome]|uniref:Uncharacterized protein n=1 Tax=bioreactor metagenome TaxID=1076179 RepID=A0A645DC07_9ZZZZ